MKKIIPILAAAMLSCSVVPNPCQDFNTIVIREEAVPNGGDLVKRIYTEFAIYGLGVNKDTITRQPLRDQPCHHDLIYSPEWVACCKD